MLVLHRVAASGHHPAPVFGVAVDVARMADDIDGGADDLGRRPGHDPAEGVVGLLEASVEVEECHPRGGMVERQAEPLRPRLVSAGAGKVLV